MNRNRILKAVCMGCILVFLSACGVKAPQVSPTADQPSDNTQTDVRNENQNYITVAEVKAAVLENAGLLEENVRFVRINLDSGSDAGRYDIEFISADTEYDYIVDAVTGEILSMVCENGTYDIDEIPEEVTQAVQEPPVTGNVPPESAQGTQGQQQSTPTAQGQQQSTPTAQGQQQSTPTAQGQQQSTPTAQGQQQSTPTAQGGAEAGQQYIGVDAAKEIALEHAGLQAADVRFVHAHLEFDDGYWQYDIEFHKGSTEYDYNIDAQNGKIISYDYDAEYYQHGADSSSGSGQITKAEAKRIALEYAGIAETEAQYMKVEFDYDDGRAEYEIEWYVGRMEYSCDVDANTGAVLSFEKEYD